MHAFVALGFLAATAVAGPLSEAEQYAPIPYQFAYRAESEEGSHGHTETSDGNGNAQGEYFLKLADGRARNVRYNADINGFNVEIETNELGTESMSPANAKYSSSSITGAEAALQYGAQPEQVQVNPRLVKYAAPARTVVKTVQTAPIYTTARSPVTVVKAAPTVVKAVQSAPVSYTYSQAPVSYAVNNDEHHIIAH